MVKTFIAIVVIIAAILLMKKFVGCVVRLVILAVALAIAAIFIFMK